MKIAPYDGCAEFHAESAEHFVSFMKRVYDSAHLVGTYALSSPTCQRNRRPNASEDVALVSSTWSRDTMSWRAMTI